MKVRLISLLVAFVLLFGPVVLVDGKGKGGGQGGSRGGAGGGNKSGIKEKGRGGDKAGSVESAKDKGKSDATAKVKDAKEVSDKAADKGKGKGDKAASKGPGKAGRAAKGKDSKAGSEIKVRGKDKAGKVKEVDKSKAQGKEHQKQLAALKRQVTHEDQKHLKRSARLARIHQLAVDSGDEKTIARIDKLISREQGRYDSKVGRMNERRNRIMGLSAGQKGPDLDAAEGKIKGKPKKEKVQGDEETKEAAEKAEEAAEKAKEKAESSAQQ